MKFCNTRGLLTTRYGRVIFLNLVIGKLDEGIILFGQLVGENIIIFLSYL